MRRREFMAILAGAAVASPQSAVHRVGVLLVGNEDADTFRRELYEEMHRSGYIDLSSLNFRLPMTHNAGATA